VLITGASGLIGSCLIDLLMIANEKPFFVPTTIYGWIMLLFFGLSLCVIPIFDLVYVILLILDKIQNNKKENQLSFIQKINVCIFLLVTVVSFLIMLASAMQGLLSRDRKILLKPQVEKVDYQKKYLILKYDLPSFANSNNMTNAHNDPIFIKLKTNVKGIATFVGQTRKKPVLGMYLRGWTDFCYKKEIKCKNNKCYEVTPTNCNQYCENGKCTTKCQPIFADKYDECRQIDYRGISRYHVKNNENIEQVKEDIENGALLEAVISNDGYVLETRVIK